jgi:protein-S-isoprenylcysteine O-methyltransferase Ste14
MYGLLVIGIFLIINPLLLTLLFGARPLALPPNVGQMLSFVGLSLMIAGGALSYFCMIIFITRGHGTAFPEEPPQILVVSGAYRFVRNPMYLGNLALALGIGLALRSTTYTIYAIILAFATHLYISRVEEPALLRRYGDAYKNYCATTNRWVPRRFNESL